MKKLLLLSILIPILNFSQVQIGQDIINEVAGDESGSSISISANGNILAIGAPENDGNGDASGHVRIYENQGGTWVQIGQDINGEAAFDKSGDAISLNSDGSIIAIGAFLNGSVLNDSDDGHVRVYENQGGTWVQIGQDINAEGVGDFFGKSVSLNDAGNILAIGATFNDNLAMNSGSVSVYENQGGMWVQVGDTFYGEDINYQLGTSVSLNFDGNIVAIGARENNNEGYVRVFENQGESWVQIGDDIDGEANGDQFGASISLNANGNIIAIGAFSNDGNGLNSGHVRIYENQGGSWVKIGDDIDGEAALDFSGFSVDLNSVGDIVAIGALTINNSFTGATRIYKNQGGSWVQIGDDIDGVSTGDYFGNSVSLSSAGDIVAVGAPTNTQDGISTSYVKVFSIVSELGLLEVTEDILGNSNGVNVTAEQLNAIEGVFGAIDGVNYTTALQNGTYADPNNPTALEIQFIIDQVNASLSIEDNEKLKFSIYPNPAKDQFTIQLENPSELKNVSIYNNLGQLVLTSKEAIIDSSKLASGLYTLEIETTNGKGTKKLIIE